MVAPVHHAWAAPTTGAWGSEAVHLAPFSLAATSPRRSRGKKESPCFWFLRGPWARRDSPPGRIEPKNLWIAAGRRAMSSRSFALLFRLQLRSRLQPRPPSVPKECKDLIATAVPNSNPPGPFTSRLFRKGRAVLLQRRVGTLQDEDSAARWRGHQLACVSYKHTSVGLSAGVHFAECLSLLSPLRTRFSTRFSGWSRTILEIH